MAKKKIKVERKPTPARFMLCMSELESRLRRAKNHRNIAVCLPKEMNNLLWISENFPYSEKMQDLILPIEFPFVAANLKTRLAKHRIFNPNNMHLVGYNSMVMMIEGTAPKLSHMYEQPSEPADVLWWFYSPSDNPTEKQSLSRDFDNHMHYDDTIQPCFIIDHWLGIPNYTDHYIPLAGAK